MRKIIKKLWGDSVLSKLIAVGLIAIATVIINLVKSYFNNTDFLIEFNRFWQLKIDLWLIILFSVFVYLLFWLINKSKKKFLYDQEILELDKKIFQKIRTELIGENVVLDLKSNAFSTHPVDIKQLHFVRKTLRFFDNPNSEFINPKLEGLKMNLSKSLVEFENSLSGNLFGTRHDDPEERVIISIPQEWDLEKYSNAQKEIAFRENQVSENFEILVKVARRVLKI